MVDAGDLKSLASNGVRVRVPPRVLWVFWWVYTKFLGRGILFSMPIDYPH